MPTHKITVRGKPSVDGSAHALKVNRASPRPRHLLFVDTETRVVQETEGVQWQAFRLGVTCYVQRRAAPGVDTVAWGTHHSAGSVTDEILRRTAEKQTLFVVASNPSFDLWVLKFYDTLRGKGWRLSFFYDEGMRFILVCRQGKRAIKVIATQNYFEKSVAELGKMIGLGKLDTEPLGAADAELEVYCRRDVEIIMGAFLGYLDFLDRQDVGGFALTISGQAFNAFRHRFLDGRLWVHRDEEALGLERECYFGGRTELFVQGLYRDGPFVQLDVNSLYPHVMADYPYPTNLCGIIENPGPEHVSEALERGCVCAWVSLDIKHPLFAVLVDDKTCFPTGRWETGVCSLGLALAVKTGALRKVHRMAVYKRGYIFRDFVGRFYGERQKFKAAGRRAWSDLCKLLLNSLYGKFGQANPITVKRQESGAPSMYRLYYIPKDGSGPMIVTQIMGTLIVTQGRHEGRESMPAVAAHVTEYGRLYLARLMETVGWGRVLYVDTDSLLVREGDMAPLTGSLHDTDLGALKVEHTWDWVRLHGLKDYETPDGQVIKAVGPRGLCVGPDTYQATQFPGLKSLLYEGKGESMPLWDGGDLQPELMQVAAERGLYPVRQTLKVMDRSYSKGVVEPGGRVRPLSAP